MFQSGIEFLEDWHLCTIFSDFTAHKLRLKQEYSWGQRSAPKLWYLCTNQNVVTHQKSGVFLSTTVTTFIIEMCTCMGREHNVASADFKSFESKTLVV
jgi:hypothetical protein